MKYMQRTQVYTASTNVLEGVISILPLFTATKDGNKI